MLLADAMVQRSRSNYRQVHPDSCNGYIPCITESDVMALQRSVAMQGDDYARILSEPIYQTGILLTQQEPRQLERDTLYRGGVVRIRTSLCLADKDKTQL